MIDGYLLKSKFFHTDHAPENPETYTQSPSATQSISHQPWTLSGPSNLGLLSPVASIVKASASLLLSYRDGLSDEERAAERRIEEKKQVLHIRLRDAGCMNDYNDAATQLDQLCGNVSWKSIKESVEYDYELIEAKLKELDDARFNHDVARMLYLVRTALCRDLGGMGNARLYKHSYVGTKDLIEQYIDSTLATIQALVNMREEVLPAGVGSKDVLEQVLYARQAFGRSALLLSGGATFGMNHIGVLKALFEAKLLPRIISGASAGSIVCSVLCTTTDEEIPAMLERFPYGDLAVFDEEGNEDGLFGHVGRFLTEGAWIDIKHLSRVMRGMLGDMTFQEAYNRTRRILNICVSSASIYELPRLLNYVTSPNIMIWSAVAASCSVPLLFSAAPLLIKNPLTGKHEEWNPSPQKWVDGSVDNDLPMVKLSEMFNVNHFLVSQVNPHVVPFLEGDETVLTEAAQAPDDTTASGTAWAYKMTNLAKDEAIHRLHVMSDMGIFPNMATKLRSVLSQKYSGDITILPEINYRDFPRMLKNPTSAFMLDACLRGERATWPKLSRIRNHCAIELELDAAVQSLRTNVVFSPSQVNLRKLSTSGTLANGRVRRVSGSFVLPLSAAEQGNGSTLRHEREEEVEYFGDMPTLRPPIKSHSSYWSTRDKQSLPPLARQVHSSYSRTRPLEPRADVSVLPRLPQSDMSATTPIHSQSSDTTSEESSRISTTTHALASETETDQTPLDHMFVSDADADVDTTTDYSSADGVGAKQSSTSNATKSNNTKPVLKISTPPDILVPGQASYFSASQPATPGQGVYSASLSLNATTPPSFFPPTSSIEKRGSLTPRSRSPVSKTPTAMMSPELSMTRGRGQILSSSRRVKSKSQGHGEIAQHIDNIGASSPERRYKKLFHGAN